MWIRKLIEENPMLLTHRQLPLSEIVAGLKENYGAVDLSTEEIPSLSMHEFNAFHLPRNEILQLPREQLRIQGLKIPITPQTAHFTGRDYVPLWGEDSIYLAYETQVGYLYSNSRKLFLEAAIARGISPEEARAEGEDYYSYLHYLQGYLESFVAPFVRECGDVE